MKSPRRGSGICLEGWGGDPGGRVLGRAPSITVGLTEANLAWRLPRVVQHNYIMQQLRSYTDINFLCFCKTRTYCSLYSTSIVSFSSRLLDKNTKISHVPNRSKLSINRVLEKQDLFTHFDV